jgi:hypothetical protein
MRILVDDDFAASVTKWMELGAPGEFLVWNAERRDAATKGISVAGDERAAANEALNEELS